MRIALFLLSFLLLLPAALANVEEARLARAEAALPGLRAPFAGLLEELDRHPEQAEALGAQGFAVGKAIALAEGDDRPLYWFRLAGKARLRAAQLAPIAKDRYLHAFERASRGISDIRFDDGIGKILITGFDPFFLDRNIGQSNPSGLAALRLDGQIIAYQGKQARIEAALVPVRFADFDQGLIETLLLPHYKDDGVDMVVTISMGRQDFDLERFPGRNRSAAAPDNLNVLTGASKEHPLAPRLHGKPLRGPEFVEFSLPVAAMVQTAPFPVHDNNKVGTLSGDLAPTSLAQLKGETSVSGAGGGYLSNEISYRAIRLRNNLGSSVPSGHIHTPRISGYEKDKEIAIVEQIRAMLARSLAAL
ncbi:hypothetical protein [Gallaecimonas sp. GXIMD4217]|uniref:pyroglutamyl-peptidase I family protein n=1 Tax=Gallaecimonas sp. GXIMD4217 TaxID=3131927 RepID=UPI00311B27A1